MPYISLMLFAVFVLVGFGWRSWRQHRRTGSTGFRGISGRVGSMEWFGGIGFVAALVAAVAAPVLQLTGVVSPVTFATTAWVQLTGIGVAVTGIGAMIRAQLDMGDSWRIGVDDGEATALVRTGMFSRVRNPFFTATLTFGLGLVLITPNILAFTAFVVLFASIEVQFRLAEEPYLLRAHAETYREYAAKVGRFVPGLGLLHGQHIAPDTR